VQRAVRFLDQRRQLRLEHRHALVVAGVEQCDDFRRGGVEVVGPIERRHARLASQSRHRTCPPGGSSNLSHHHAKIATMRLRGWIVSLALGLLFLVGTITHPTPLNIVIETLLLVYGVSGWAQWSIQRRDAK